MNFTFKPCAIIVERAEDIAAFANYTDDGASSTVKVEKKEQETTSKVDQTPIVKSESKPASTGSSTGGDRAMASPLAKKLAQEKGIDLKVVTIESLSYFLLTIVDPLITSILERSWFRPTRSNCC